jgi:hypothetical protein
MTLEDFRKITKNGAWKSRTLLLLNGQPPQPEITGHFGTYWIEGGHHIREQIADDRVLVCLLRHMLPPYEGSALTLFRGGNLERWEAGQVGLAWTTDIDVARMFGRGLNSVRSGGVLLKGHFEPEAIIAGPNGHSCYLGEGQYTVDPSYAANIILVEKFRAVS